MGAARKHPSSNASSMISNRGAKTMYIFRQSLIGTTAPSLSSKVCVKSSVTGYFVLLSPLANRRVAPLPAVHWKPEIGGSFFIRVPASQEPGVEDS